MEELLESEFDVIKREHDLVDVFKSGFWSWLEVLVRGCFWMEF